MLKVNTEAKSPTEAPPPAQVANMIQIRLDQAIEIHIDDSDILALRQEEEEEERQPVHHVSVPPQPPVSGLPSQQQSLKHVSPPQTKPEPDVITRQPSTTPGQNNSPRRESTSCNTSAFSQVICRLN